MRSVHGIAVAGGTFPAHDLARLHERRPTGPTASPSRSPPSRPSSRPSSASTRPPARARARVAATTPARRRTRARPRRRTRPTTRASTPASTTHPRRAPPAVKPQGAPTPDQGGGASPGNGSSAAPGSSANARRGTRAAVARAAGWRVRAGPAARRAPRSASSISVWKMRKPTAMAVATVSSQHGGDGHRQRGVARAQAARHDEGEHGDAERHRVCRGDVGEVGGGQRLKRLGERVHAHADHRPAADVEEREPQDLPEGQHLACSGSRPSLRRT